MSAQEFLEVLYEAVGGSDMPLTARERKFLLTSAGMHEHDLSAQGRGATWLVLMRDRLVLDLAALSDAMSTSEVAALLGRSKDFVERSLHLGELYALNPGDRSGLRFPRWQFTYTKRVVPGLRQILASFPLETHPLDVERFMTRANEDLNDMSPIEWLTGNRPIDLVVALIEDLGYL